MIKNYRKLSFGGIVLGTFTTFLAISISRMSLLVHFGPQGGFQFFIAMLGIWVAAGSIAVSLWKFEIEEPYDVAFCALLSLGGLYTSVMSFVLGLQLKWLSLFFSIGLICSVIGLSIYCAKFCAIWESTVILRYHLVKVLLVVWMGILLGCFLLSWGAPIEFWLILDRFGVNIGEGTMLMKIHNFLVQFLSFSQETK